LTKRRLFVAIRLPESILNAFGGLQDKLKPFARDAKWVKPAGIHLTLKFLGYVDPEKISTITDKLKLVASRHSNTTIIAKGCGFFPNARRPNVLWVGVEANLQNIVSDMEEEMAMLGFEKETRAFTPHLTLARFKDNRGLLPLGQETQKWANETFGEFTASSFVLFESILHRAGAEYRPLDEFPLETTDEHK
jgi:RNA 2',3'-cyclic 3'-phosphodiesterase